MMSEADTRLFLAQIDATIHRCRQERARNNLSGIDNRFIISRLKELVQKRTILVQVLNDGCIPHIEIRNHSAFFLPYSDYPFGEAAPQHQNVTFFPILPLPASPIPFQSQE